MSLSRPLPPLRPYSNGVRDANVRLPVIGELIMIRFPFEMPGPPSTLSLTAVSGATRQNYHPCVVTSAMEDVESWHVIVYVCRSYVHEADPSSFVLSLPPNDFDYLLPLPSNPRPAAPTTFGAPLSFDGTYFSPKVGWLIAKPISVEMGNKAYKPFQPQALLPRRELTRIKTYSATLMPPSTVSSILPPGLGGAGGDIGGSFGAGGGSGRLGTVEGGGAATGGTVGFGPAVSGTYNNRAVMVWAMDDEIDDDEDIDNDDPFANDDLFPDFLRFPSEIALREARRTSYVQNWLVNVT